MIRIEPFGNLGNGDRVNRLTVSSSDRSFSVITLGATLTSLVHKGYDAVLSHSDLSRYVDDSTYMGEVVGPVANRIANAKYVLDGIEHHLDANNGPNCLHSGSACYGRKLWKIEGYGNDYAVLSYRSIEGEGGFPGYQTVSVRYCIESDGSLSIGYEADQHGCEIPFSITNHSYFDLSSSHDCRSVLLTMHADAYAPVDSSLIPVSEENTAGSDFDFSKGELIGSRRGGAYDNAFRLVPNACVRAEGDMAMLTMATDLPAVQLYAGEFLSNGFSPFSGFALETGFYPDFINNPSFSKSILREDHPFRSETRFLLEAR